jgi:two-component system response regulator FixJ
MWKSGISPTKPALTGIPESAFHQFCRGYNHLRTSAPRRARIRTNTYTLAREPDLGWDMVAQLQSGALVSTRSKGRICIVDDDDEVRASTRLLLESMDYSVEDFDAAEGLLRSIHESPADCLILDYHLPGLSGLDLLELLREQGVTMPAIIMTANPHLAARAARAGVAVVLHKPVEAENLSQWLDRILSGKK